MKKLLYRATACALLLAMLGACSKESDGEVAMTAMPAAAEERARAPAAPAPPTTQAAAEPTVTAATPAGQMGSSAATYTDSERRFIRTAEARFTVKDVYVAALGIEDTVAGHGGFVVSNEIKADSFRQASYPIGAGKLLDLNEVHVHGKLVVRVPSEKTQDFLRAIVGHVVFLEERNFAARDAQFDLLRRQLEMRRHQQTQGELAEALREGGKLGQRTEAIGARLHNKTLADEALLARKEFEDQVAFSTISLSLQQPPRLVKAERVDIDAATREHRPAFLQRLGAAMANGGRGFVEFIIELAGVWPLLLVLAAVFSGWRAWRRRRKARVVG